MMKKNSAIRLWNSLQPYGLGAAFEMVTGRSGFIPKFEDVDPKVFWGIRHSAADFLEDWADALRGHVPKKQKVKPLDADYNPYDPANATISRGRRV